MGFKKLCMTRDPKNWRYPLSPPIATPNIRIVCCVVYPLRALSSHRLQALPDDTSSPVSYLILEEEPVSGDDGLGASGHCKVPTTCTMSGPPQRITSLRAADRWKARRNTGCLISFHTSTR